MGEASNVKHRCWNKLLVFEKRMGERTVPPPAVIPDTLSIGPSPWFEPTWRRAEIELMRNVRAL